MAKPKTPDLPEMKGDGVERKAIKSIEKLVDKIQELKEQRKELKEKLDADTETLIIEMHANKLEVYFCDGGKRIMLDAKERVTISEPDIEDED